MAKLCRFIILFTLCVFSAQISMAQTDVAPAPEPQIDASSYEALIKKAQEKNFQLSEEEYKKIMEATNARIKDLQVDMIQNGRQNYLKSIPDEGHDRMLAIETIRTEPLIKGKESKVTLRLTYVDNNEPVTLDHLQVFHTKPIHLMINEPQLDDYYHKHPEPSDVPGEYVFSFVPKTDCTYRVWADLFPTDGPEQTAQTDLAGAKECSDLKPAQTVNASAELDGYKFMMSMNTKELAKGQDTMVYFDVMDKGGKAFMGLEPVMGAYAHLVGFRGDYSGIAHIHPMGDEPFSNADRGGPTLEFHMRPEYAGYMRFYLQVLIDGKMRFVPFGVQIAETGESSSEDAIKSIMNMNHDDAIGYDDAGHEADHDNAHDAADH